MLIKFVFVFLTIFGFANEEGGHGGSEGGGHGEPPAGNLPEWVYIENRLAALESSIKSKQTTLEKLIEEKNHLDPSSHKVKEVIKEIVSINKDINSDIEDYEKQKTILRYRFPERGADAKRKYKQIESKSVEELEADQGIDSRLTKAMKKMRTQYESEPIKSDIQKSKKAGEEKPKPIIIHK